MSSFSREDVERVARLARLELTDEEKTLFASQLAEILTYAEQIQAIDTTGIDPTSHALSAPASMRTDDVLPSFDRATALAQAPDGSPAGLFKVPRVL